ncbi:MAG TPA: hypothetical protein VLF95_13210 [Vicinamibacteria bacterium]|nr:hypothetical protein [Vicinamibacteria bacterium]
MTTPFASRALGLLVLVLVAVRPDPASAQAPPPTATDANTPLHLLGDPAHRFEINDSSTQLYR